MFWNTPKDVRHRTRSTRFNLLVATLIPIAIFVVYTLFVSLLTRLDTSYRFSLNPQLHCWWANSSYGSAIGMENIPFCHKPEVVPYRCYGGMLCPQSYNYKLTISDRGQWSQPDFAAKYRSLLNEVRTEQRLAYRRSHIQQAGTRVTCWPRLDIHWEDQGFYSRHVDAVDLAWLDLPRFQDTLRSEHSISEDKFCERFKKLLPYYYANSSWYHEIVKLDEKHAREHLLGCEPGFHRKLSNGRVREVVHAECYKRSPLVAWENVGERDVMWYLEQSIWALGTWKNGARESNSYDPLYIPQAQGPLKWEPAGKVKNALTMPEKTKSIDSYGGLRMMNETLKNFMDCWYRTANVDCDGRNEAGYEDWDFEKAKHIR